MWKDLTEQQKTVMVVHNQQREIDGVDEGVSRYAALRRHVEIGAAETDIIRICLDRVTDWIAKDQKSIKAGRAKRGRPQSWAGAYLSMSAEKLAFLGLRSMLSEKTDKLTRTTAKIAQAIKLELELDEIKRLNRLRTKEEKGFTSTIKSKLDDAKKVKNLYDYLTKKPMKWRYTEQVGLGARVVQAVIESTGMWDLMMTYDKKRKVYILTRCDDLTEYILQKNAKLEVMKPVVTPMCCPPTDWEVVEGTILGGYRVHTTPFVRQKSNQVGTEHSLSDMTRVMSAVNTIQAVEWTIDTDILKLAQFVRDRSDKDWDNAVSFVPPRRTEDPYPKNGTKEQRKVWHHNNDVYKSARQASVSKRIMQMMAINCAEDLVNKPVYFPHSLDWRGRIYPVTSVLSPQGGDIHKALLRFAEKKPLGKTGLRSLMITAAGYAGVDKVSFDERIKWIKDNYFQSDWEPYSDTRWVDYDKPFMFVQAMNEIRAALKTRHPETFMSNVSCGIDGSQNGLQHLSAIGLDAVGGSSVNLTDHDKPADLYSDVAQLVHAAIVGDYEAAMASGETKDAVGQDLPPIAWLETMSHPKKRRAAVKRSVLAYPYGVTKPGMSAGLITDGITDGLSGSRHHNAWYLATHIDNAVRDVVISAGQLMDWFREVARLKADTNKPVRWVAPSGFPVDMHYLEMDAKVIETCLAKLTVRVPNEAQTIDVEAMVRGIVANFIHSLDASHLIGTCNQCFDEGITSLHFIHDSYGTHACDIDRLGQITRQQFVDMHKTNPLQRFVDGLGIEVPPLPPKGTLNLDSVLESKFFFA